MQVCLPLRSGYEAVVTNQATGRRHGIGVDVSIEWRSFHDHVAILEFWLQAGLIFDFGLVSMVLLCWVRSVVAVVVDSASSELSTEEEGWWVHKQRSPREVIDRAESGVRILSVR